MTLQKLSFLIFENIISIPPLLLQQPESWQLSKKWKKKISWPKTFHHRPIEMYIVLLPYKYKISFVSLYIQIVAQHLSTMSRVIVQQVGRL